MEPPEQIRIWDLRLQKPVNLSTIHDFILRMAYHQLLQKQTHVSLVC
jgi:hypothetical protein